MHTRIISSTTLSDWIYGEDTQPYAHLYQKSCIQIQAVDLLKVGYGDLSPSTMFGKLVRFGEVVNEVYTHYYYSTGWGDMCCGRSACELTKTFILFGFDDLDCVQSTLSKMSKYLYFFLYLCVGARPTNPKKCLYFCIFIFVGRCLYCKSP